jgi:hypothetical protein
VALGRQVGLGANALQIIAQLDMEAIILEAGDAEIDFGIVEPVIRFVLLLPA